MKVSAIRLCTVGVRDLNAAAQLFEGVLKLRVEAKGSFSAEELLAYHLPASTRAEYIELSCAGYPVGRLRLVQYTPVTQERVRFDHGGGDSATDVGPKAIDFYVADPIAPRIAEIERAGYRFRSLPIRHRVGETESEECLFSGPDEVPILLMVGHRHSDAERRPGCLIGPYSEIATVSVVAENLEASRGFYEKILGLRLLVDAETTAEHRRSVGNLTGIPSGTRIHFRMYAEPGEASGKILLVHFFEGTGRRLVDRMRLGRLGFSLMSLATDDVRALHAALIDGGYVILTPPTVVRCARGQRRVLLAIGPNEDLYEFNEEL